MSRELLPRFFIALCALFLINANCRGEGPPPEPGADAGALVSAPEPPGSAASSTPASAPGHGSSPGKGHEEPPPGSREVTLIAPAAPTVFVLAGLKGYTEPCGCTLDVLVGGIDRITGYADAYKKLSKQSVLIDAGDTLFDEPDLAPHRVAQEQAKVDVIIEGLKTLGVAHTTPGPNDFALGKVFYLDKIRGAGLEILAANVREAEGDLPLGPGHVVHDLGEVKLGVVGVVEPELFGGVEGLTFSDPTEAARKEIAAARKEGATTILIVDHGKLGHAKKLLEDIPEAHFVVVGHDPRETDAVDEVNKGWTLEAYDQGRFLGVLQLYPQGEAKPARFANARHSSKAELERVERRIEQIDAQISRLPPATPGKEPEILLTLRNQLTEAKAERERLKTEAVALPAKGAAFVWRPIAMEPGFPLNAHMKETRDAFNARLEEIATANAEAVAPVTPGQAEYMGVEVCGKCHVAAVDFWKKTAHARAVQTLVTRNKLFDGNCIGCHVTGYRQPGGSVIGKLEYTATVDGQILTKRLQDVGCEVCHGPGSLHARNPLDAAGKAQHITRSVPEERCVTCHNTEHSTRFNYSNYVKQITGAGHRWTGP